MRPKVGNYVGVNGKPGYEVTKGYLISYDPINRGYWISLEECIPRKLLKPGEYRVYNQQGLIKTFGLVRLSETVSIYAVEAPKLTAEELEQYLNMYQNSRLLSKVKDLSVIFNLSKETNSEGACKAKLEELLKPPVLNEEEQKEYNMRVANLKEKREKEKDPEHIRQKEKETYEKLIAPLKKFEKPLEPINWESIFSVAKAANDQQMYKYLRELYDKGELTESEIDKVYNFISTNPEQRLIIESVFATKTPGLSPKVMEQTEQTLQKFRNASGAEAEEIISILGKLTNTLKEKGYSIRLAKEGGRRKTLKRKGKRRLSKKKKTKKYRFLKD